MQLDGTAGRLGEALDGAVDEGGTFGALRGGLVGPHEVSGDNAGQFRIAQSLQVLGGRYVLGAPLLAGKAVVGDLTNERLDEPVLAALG